MAESEKNLGEKIAQRKSGLEDKGLKMNTGLPRWLSGLSHSAHRPEQPTRGAGVQSPVGR